MPLACSVTNNPFELGSVPRRCKNKAVTIYVEYKLQGNVPTLQKQKHKTKIVVQPSPFFPRVPKKHLPSFAQSEFLSISVGLPAELREETVLGVWGADPDVVSSNNHRLKWSYQYSVASQVQFCSLMSGFKWSEARGFWWLVWILFSTGGYWVRDWSLIHQDQSKELMFP